MDNANGWYLWSLTGNVSGSLLTTADDTLIGQGGSATGCKTSISLTLSETRDGTRLQGTWSSTQSGCSSGTVDITRYGGQATKNLGSGARCDGGLGSARSGTGSGGTASGNANGSSCAEAMGASVVGDPIDASTGNFHLQEDDFDGGPWLTFRRFYNSNGATAPATMGFRWRHVFDRSLSITGAPATSIVVLRPDGKQATYTRSDSASPWTTDMPTDVLTDKQDQQGQTIGYSLFVGGTRQTETYDLTGRLISVIGQDGQGITLSYTTTASPAIGLLSTVTDSKGRQLVFSYDSSSRLKLVSLPDGKRLAYNYGSSSSNLSQVVYANDEVRRYLYNESEFIGATPLPNALTGITNENGVRYESITYDDLGRATSSSFNGNVGTTKIAYQADGSSAITYPLGNTVRLTPVSIDGLMRVSSLSGPCAPDCGQLWQSRTYDTRGFPASMVDFNGVTTQTTYDALGLLEAKREAVGKPEERRIETTWDTNLRLPLITRVLDGSGTAITATSRVYGPTGLLLAQCEADLAVTTAANYTCSPSGAVPSGVRRWTYTYCTVVDATQCPVAGLLLTRTGPRKDTVQTTTYQYYMDDSTQWHHGDLKSITDAMGHVTTIARYDGAGRPTRVIDANGVITDFTYMARGWLQTKTVRANADGSSSSSDAVTTISYTSYGNVESITDPTGIVTNFAYDSARRLTDIKDPAGNRIHYVLDAAGNRVQEQVINSSGTVIKGVTRTYSALGRLTGMLDGLNRVVADSSAPSAYDGNGNLLESVDGLGVQTKTSYDGLNRLIATIGDAGGKSAATHHTETIVQYDPLDRLVGVSDPEGLATTYTRNAFGDVVDHVSPDTGQSAATFDDAGNVTTATDARGVAVSYTYDALDRRISATYPHAEANVSWHYDEPDSVTGCPGSSPVGRLTRIVESAVTTTYCYDKRGNLTQKSQALGSQTDTTVYTYTRADRLDTLTYPNGSKLTYYRDNRGRVASITFSSPGFSQSVVGNVTYLPFGPITSYTLGNGQNIKRTYDANFAVTDVTSPVLNLHFARDVMGNLVSLGSPPGASPATESYGYDPLYRLTSVNDANNTAIETYTYNQTGDRLSKTAPGLATGVYGYQAGTHWLTSIGTATRTHDANGNTTGSTAAGETLGYTYNDRNRMSSVQRNGSVVGTYVYNALGERLSKTVTTPAAATTRFIYDENSRLLGEYGATARDYVWLEDLPVAIVDGSGSTLTVGYVHADALGSPRAVSDSKGAIIWTWAFQGHPFGEVLPTSASGFVLNLRFPGQYFDAESGLNYNVNRDYEAATGRYIQSDPIGLRAGAATYSYVTGSPLAYADPLGTQVVIPVPRPVVAPPLPYDGTPAASSLPNWGPATPVWACIGPYCVPTNVPAGLSDYADWMSHHSTPKPGSKPKNCPGGTKPIDQTGLSKDDVHDIKHGVGAGPQDWTGIAPNGDVITGDHEGNAVNHGNYGDYTQ
ncbi:RHS repeat protein [Luteibacter flocculans]|uniref:RHS repeat protein n=1 Tax=Luteibacter flocculans TaxID=2780091 RepID=A0ABY4T545_9GAMM|nr:RHS repeat-associated core domain-containing protein [Luteibacter flocculans]URL59855.1 RHS repeat protein [Luteibacter flocculans]